MAFLEPSKCVVKNMVIVMFRFNFVTLSAYKPQLLLLLTELIQR